MEPPIKPSKVLDLNSKIDRSVSIIDQNLAQSYCKPSDLTKVECISNLFEALYKMAENYGMDLNELQAERSVDEEFKAILSDYSETVLMCYDLIGSNITGDYYLNTRNSNVQKMIKMTLYYGLEDLNQKIIAFISKECLFQSMVFVLTTVNAGDDVIQRVMMTSKIAINIGQCLPELQTRNTWYSLLDFLEDLNVNLKRFQKSMLQTDKQQAGPKLGLKSQSTFNSDVAVTLGSITNLFDLSAGFSEVQFVNLMSAISRIITEYLDSKLKKKKADTISEGDCICQFNLGAIWRSNSHRLGLVVSEVKSIVATYLEHNLPSAREFGILRLFELLKLLHSSEDE